MNYKSNNPYIEITKDEELSKIVAYETKTYKSISESSSLSAKMYKRKIGIILKDLNDDDLQKIKDLESRGKIYIFPKPVTIYSMEIIERSSDGIKVIFQSGALKEIQPNASERINPNEYKNTYDLDVNCRGFAVLIHSRVARLIAEETNDSIKNHRELRITAQKLETRIISLEDKEKSIKQNILVEEKRLENITEQLKSRQLQVEITTKKLLDDQDEISKIEAIKQDMIEETTQKDSQLKDLASQVELSKNHIKTATHEANEINEKILNLDERKKEIERDISTLTQQKNLFDNELVGYSTEGRETSKIYLLIAVITMGILFVATIVALYRGIELIELNTDQPMIDLFISRMPLSLSLCLIISMSFALTYFMIKQAITINTERMKFMQASIIAKDMWTASEINADLSSEERERLRQQAKIKLITKIFEESTSPQYDAKLFERVLDKLLSKE